MKRFALLAVVALVALGLVPASAGAGVLGTGQVTIVHDATYDFGEPFPVTLCLDGDLLDASLEFGDILEPATLPADTYVVDIFLGADQPCAVGEGDISEELVVEAGDDLTAAAVWTSVEGQDPGLVVWDNDYGCYEAATPARLIVRHGAATNGPVDVVGLIDGVETTIIANLAEGDQAMLDLSAPLTVVDGAVVAAGTDDVLIDLGDNDFEAGFAQVLYAGGGADGTADVFVDFIELDPCEEPVVTTTTTAAPTTTTTAPPAARPAAVTPRFTG